MYFGVYTQKKIIAKKTDNSKQAAALQLRASIECSLYAHTMPGKRRCCSMLETMRWRVRTRPIITKTRQIFQQLQHTRQKSKANTHFSGRLLCSKRVCAHLMTDNWLSHTHTHGIGRRIKNSALLFQSVRLPALRKET